MSTKNSNAGLIASIIFASVVISGSLVFFGLKYFDKGTSQEEILDGIQAYVDNQEKAAQQAQEEENKPKLIEGDHTDDDPVLGDKDAPITIVEFSDYECPYCGAFYNDAYPKIRSEYIDTGKVKLVFRDYPLSFHPNAYPAALFAECVRDQKGDGAYFAVHDQIFETIENGFDYDSMSKFAVGIGADQAQLKTCFDSEKFKEEIAQDQADGQALGITGTPGFIVDGWAVKGAQPFESFQQIIEAGLAEKDAN
ncbi:MAG: DsbA family protein [Patescibacteria group bacterium]